RTLVPCAPSVFSSGSHLLVHEVPSSHRARPSSLAVVKPPSLAPMAPLIITPPSVLTKSTNMMSNYCNIRLKRCHLRLATTHDNDARVLLIISTCSLPKWYIFLMFPSLPLLSKVALGARGDNESASRGRCWKNGMMNATVRAERTLMQRRGRRR
ncbi:hypothetical protein BHM03_00046650, partial [Ensete ventricosum]